MNEVGSYPLKKGEIFMLQRVYSKRILEVFPNAENLVYYHYEPGRCSWFLSLEEALNFALKAGWKEGTWKIVKMVPEEI